jgi:hypothetical protein
MKSAWFSLTGEKRLDDRPAFLSVAFPSVTLAAVSNCTRLLETICPSVDICRGATIMRPIQFPVE